MLFPWWVIWPEKSAQGPPKPPVKPPAPSVEEPRDGPLNDAYPGTRWFRLLEVVKAWAYNHAREYSKRDRFHTALVWLPLQAERWRWGPRTRGR